MRYTHHRGLARVSAWVRLKYAAMNLKKIAIGKWNASNFASYIMILPRLMIKRQSSCFENWRSLTSWGKHPWCLPALITAEQGRAGRSMAAHLCAVHLDH